MPISLTPRDLEMPAKFKAWRGQQEDVIGQIVNSDKPLYLLDAPTGSGKSIIGIASSYIWRTNWLTTKVLQGEDLDRRGLPKRVIYVTRTKQLQDQLLCIGPRTRILKTDLTWTHAEEIKIGDNLVGFDENINGGGNRRKWKNSLVEEIQRIKRPSYRLTFNDGTIVTCSEEHPWLVAVGQKAHYDKRWIQTKKLRVDNNYPSRVSKLLDVWENEKTWESGYLAAAFDGEGALSQNPTAKCRGAAVALNFCQSHNQMLERVKYLLTEKGYGFTPRLRLAKSIKHHDQTILEINNRPDIFRFLGTERPVRLLAKFDIEKMGAIFNKATPTLIKKEFLGEIEVIAIRTSTRTYVAEGLASHNCDFPKSRTIKGRANFPCLMARKKFPEFTAEDCPHQGKGTTCSQKAFCPYLLAKAEALQAEIAILNESYYLAEANGPGQFSAADFVILDQVDSIESTLMNNVSMNITQNTLKEFGLEPPANWEDWKDWVTWWNTTQNKRVSYAAAMETQCELFGDDWMDIEIKASRKLRHLDNFNNNLNTFMQETLRQLINASQAEMSKLPISADEAVRITISGKETPFVVQDHRDKTGYITRLELKPVTVRNFAKQRLWRHAERFLGMSGTILSPVVLARELGITEEQYDYRQIPSPFAVKNRPIFFWPVANMRKQNIDAGDSLAKMLAAIQQILDKYPNDKILIHTASDHVLSAIKHDQVDLKENSRIITHDPDNRADQLEAFKNSRKPLVMLSPSFDRGVDLPGDQCRCVIICKVPYLNLGDKQVAARLKAPGGDQWYVFKALQTIMQMSGRGVRSETDFCDTFILDQQFTGLLARTRQYVPAWWLEAIRRIENL